MKRLLAYAAFLLPVVAAGAPPGGVPVSTGSEYVEGELLVKFRPQVVRQSRDRLIRSLRAHKADEDSHGLTRLRLPAGQSVAAAAALYAADPSVEYAEPNYIYRLLGAPDDRWYGEQWGLKNTGQEIGGTSGMPGYDIDAERAWAVRTDCTGVLVAVIDTGINYTHVDLAANMWDGGEAYPNHGYDFVDEDNDPMASDGHPHGTHVAGTIAADGNNGRGTSGVCWEAEIMALRAVDAEGRVTTADAVQAIDFAVERGARIINASFGGVETSQAWAESVERARQHGVLLVAGAGNDGTDNDMSGFFPCSFPHDNVICVAALDQHYERADVSNYGTASVDLGAPGVSVLSTSPGAYEFVEQAGWSLDGWAVDATPGCHASLKPYSIVLQGGSCSDALQNYPAGLDARAFASVDLRGAYLLGAGVHFMAAARLDEAASLEAGLMMGSGDPFAGEVIIPMAREFEWRQLGSDLSWCIGGECTFGIRLQTASAGSGGIVVGNVTLRKTEAAAATYEFMTGTSMATPHVTGIAALVWAQNPNYSYADVRRAILEGSDPVGSLSGLTSTGHAADAYEALRYIQAPSGVTATVR